MRTDPRAREASTVESPPALAGPFAGTIGQAFAVAVVLALAVGVVLRFVTKSDLWLDEALTVNIAARPLGQLHHLLVHDGAPPLYYVLLHVWMRVFGSSDLGARSLSGVIGVATLPVVWVSAGRIARRLRGASRAREQWFAWSAVLVMATSSYAIRYSTEARMYMLEVLLALLGYLAVSRALERPTLGRLALVTVITAALLYTQYWAIYLLVVVGAGLLWTGWRGAPRIPARRVLLALVAGGVLFVPWLPTFLEQAKHTGTPWATGTAPPSAAFLAFQEFAGADHIEGYSLLLPLLVLALLGVFGIATGRLHVDLDVRTVPTVRWEAYVGFATLALGLTLSFLANSAFQGRYAAIMFGFFVLVVVAGVLALGSPILRYGALALVVALGLVGGVRNVVTNRTQASQVVDAIAASARPGDVVGYCPDQLGPDAARLLPARLGLKQYTFPSFASPDIVDWVDYADKMHAGSAARFAAGLLRRAGSGGTVFLVSSSGYRSLGDKCAQIGSVLRRSRPSATTLVQADQTLFEHDGLVRFRP